MGARVLFHTSNPLLTPLPLEWFIQVIYMFYILFTKQTMFPENIVFNLKSEVVSLQTAHSWTNAGVLLGDACIGSGVAFEAI